MNSLAVVGGRALLRAPQIPGVRYEFKPDLDVLFMLQPFHTNRFGMRDRPRNLAKAPGSLRLALVGDSFAMGFALPEEATFGRLLEPLLSERLGRKVEVLNFAVSGYSLLDYAGIVAERVGAFGPDLVLVGMCFNDFEPEHLARVRFDGVTRTPGFLRSHLWDQYLALLRHRSQPVEPPRPEGPPVYAGSPSERSQFPYVHYWLGRIREHCDRLGVPVLFVYLNFDRLDKSAEGQQVFARVAAELGVDYIDLTPAFEGLDAGSLFVLPNDSHPGARANQIFAGELLEPIAARLAKGR